MTVPSPTPRRIARPSWLDLRLVLGVGLVVVCVLVGAVVFSRADHRYAIVTATRDLSAGTVVRADDVTTSQVQVPDHGRGVYLASTGDVVGKQLTRDVSAGELVPRAAVAKPQTRTTVTIPLAAGDAPTLHPGQRIELWVSSPSCTSVVLLPSVTVQDVSVDTGGSFTTGTGGQDVIVSVPPDLAQRVIAALDIDNAHLRAGILAGSAQPSVTVHGGTSGLPADLAACARTK